MGLLTGLEIKGVTIFDTKGVALKIGSSEESLDFGGGKNEEVSVADEERLRQIIENLLESTLGAGKVRVRVALEINFDRVVTNSELYDPDSSVVRSAHSIDEKEQTQLLVLMRLTCQLLIKFLVGPMVRILNQNLH